MPDLVRALRILYKRKKISAVKLTEYVEREVISQDEFDWIVGVE